MKKHTTFTILLSLVYLITFAQGKFQVYMTTSLAANGTKIFMNIMDNDKRKVIKRDSALIINQSLKFTGELNQPTNFVNFFVRQKKGYSMYMMVIDTGKNEFVLRKLPEESNSNSSLTISAAKSKSNQIKSGLDSIETLFYKKNRDVDQSGITVLTKENLLSLNIEQMNYLKKYPDQYISLISLYEISLYHRGSLYTNKVLDVLKGFSSDLQNSTFGVKFFEEKKEYLKNIKTANIGSQVPEFGVKDLNGNLFKNSSLLGQNYAIIFSATWCLPCQKSLPEIKKIYEKYKAIGLKVIYFNEDDNVERWQEHVRKNNLTWINVSERVKPSETMISTKFNVFTIPSYFLINKKGIVVHNSVESNDGVEGLEKALDALYR